MLKNLKGHLTTTPQIKPIPGKNQVENNAGGFVFQTSKFEQLRRFLVLGSFGGTFYVGEGDLTRENAQSIIDCLIEDSVKTLRIIEEVSDQGLAPKNDFAIFALALSFCVKEVDSEVRNQVFDKVVRIGTHLFQFVDTVDSLRGWGNSLKKATQRWYTEKDRDALAYQLTKYRQREGWTHRDVLRKCHVHSKNENNDLRLWTVRGVVPTENVPRIIKGYERMKEMTDLEGAVKLILDYRLTHEMVPTELQANPVVLSALLMNMPLGATIRQLARMTKAGVLKMGNDDCKLVMERLVDETAIERSRIHPANFLLALMTYSKGGSTPLHSYSAARTAKVYEPIAAICDALEEGYYKAFKNVEPSDKNFLMGIDVSGSMCGDEVAGVRGISPAEAAAACAMMTVQSEPFVQCMGFAGEFKDLAIRKRDSLTGILDKTRGMSFGRTDCALPMLYAMQHSLEIDAFVILTDNETWHGRVHPVQALDQYQQKMGREAKLIVQAFTATKFSIADPNNKNMLDVVGMNSATPQILSNFVADRITV